ncbi:MAG: hypothetical protein ACRDNS_26020, partial [Trebonia sp.]
MSSSAVAAAVATAGLALLAAGCGGAGSRVAQLGSTTTRNANASGSSTEEGGALAFSRCMRSHRVPAYPDPSSSGLLPKKTPQQLGVSPATFEAAQGACIHLVPNGGRPTPAQVAQYRSVMSIYARCIRK